MYRYPLNSNDLVRHTDEHIAMLICMSAKWVRMNMPSGLKEALLKLWNTEHIVAVVSNYVLGWTWHNALSEAGVDKSLTEKGAEAIARDRIWEFLKGIRPRSSD